MPAKQVHFDLPVNIVPSLLSLLTNWNIYQEETKEKAADDNFRRTVRMDKDQRDNAKLWDGIDWSATNFAVRFFHAGSQWARFVLNIDKNDLNTVADITAVLAAHVGSTVAGAFEYQDGLELVPFGTFIRESTKVMVRDPIELAATLDGGKEKRIELTVTRDRRVIIGAPIYPFSTSFDKARPSYIDEDGVTQFHELPNHFRNSNNGRRIKF